jgi:hypothetical protein
MQVKIEGTNYTIRFSYRVVQSVLRKIGISNLSDLAKLADKMGTGNLHEMIAMAISESAKTKEVKNPKGLPSADDVLWAMDEDASIASQFFTSLSEALSSLFPPTSDPVSDAIGLGN